MLQHSGSHEEYAPRLAAAAPAILSCLTGSSWPLLDCNAVCVRGCVQLVAWAHSISTAAAPGADAGSSITSPSQYLQAPALALPEVELLSGVSVQVEAPAATPGTADNSTQLAHHHQGALPETV